MLKFGNFSLVSQMWTNAFLSRPKKHLQHITEVGAPGSDLAAAAFFLHNDECAVQPYPWRKPEIMKRIFFWENGGLHLLLCIGRKEIYTLVSDKCAVEPSWIKYHFMKFNPKHNLHKNCPKKVGNVAKKKNKKNQKKTQNKTIKPQKLLLKK